MSDIREIPIIHEAYNSARKSLVFTSALLLGWIFLGAKVEKFEFFGVVIDIASEDSLPTVLIIFILFFTIRIVFEFYQIDVVRKRKRATKWDFVTTLSIALFTLIIFVIDLNPNVELSQVILKDWFYAVFVGSSYGFLARAIVGQLSIVVEKEWHRYLFYFILHLLLFMTFYWEIVNGNYVISLSVLVSLITSYVLSSKVIVKLESWLN